MASVNQHVPDYFSDSYNDFVSYPTNLIYQTTYFGALNALKDRLDESATDLFVANDSSTDIPFRDLKSDGQAFEKRNVLSDDALQRWLGATDASHGQARPTIIKPDPKCRFIFLYADDSRKPLKVTRKSISRLFSYHQVMPGYLDFISVFGLQSEPRDLRFSGFREQILLSNPPRGPVVLQLGRSGRQYQLCYNLKSVECLTPRNTVLQKKTWSIRQAAFHHQFDVETGATLWITTKGNLTLKNRIQDMTGVTGRPEDRSFGNNAACFQSSFAVHLLYAHWSTEGWREYNQWLENKIEDETRIVKLGYRAYQPADLSSVQIWEDKTNEAIMVLETNADVLSSLLEFYRRLMDRTDLPSTLLNRKEAAQDFCIQLGDLIYDLRMQITRARLLIRITADRKQLILQHLQSQATQKMELMTKNMHNLSIMSQEDAVVMKIITVVTLIYLPATFVSTFFSTDVVKYQGQDASGSFSNMALKRWFQVTIPLTFVTLCAGWYMFVKSDKKRKSRLLSIDELPYHSMSSEYTLMSETNEKI